MNSLLPAVTSSAAMVDELRTALVVVDAGDRVVWANAAAEELLQASAARLESMTVTRAVASPDALLACIARVRETERAVTERGMAIGDATFVDCDVSLLDADSGVVMIEMHRLEHYPLTHREALGAEQGEAAQLLLRGLAHEIRNPLGGIRGAAQLLEAELSAGQREYTQVIIDEADRLRELLDRMLAPQRPLDLVTLNVHEVTDRVHALLRGQAPPGIAVERDYDPSIPELRVDRGRVIQALLNLARNALEAVSPGMPPRDTTPACDTASTGVITLRTRVAHQQSIGRERHPWVVRIEVLDNGPGVPEALAGRMFYPMVSGRSDGSGLGLSVAQALAMQHGGLVEYRRDSGPDDGTACTVFSLVLPGKLDDATLRRTSCRADRLPETAS